VYLLRGKREVYQKLAEMEAGDIPLNTTEINVLELYRELFSL